MSKKINGILNEYNYNNLNLNEEIDINKIEEKFYKEEVKSKEKKIYNKNTRKINKR